MLSDDQIKKFQEIYRETFGKEISREDALSGGIRLLRLIELIYQPITKEDFEKLQIRRKETQDL